MPPPTADNPVHTTLTALFHTVPRQPIARSRPLTLLAPLLAGTLPIGVALTDPIQAAIAACEARANRSIVEETTLCQQLSRIPPIAAPDVPHGW